MPQQVKNVRRAAVSALRSWSRGKDYAESLVHRHAQRNQLSPSDRNLLNAILLGVLRHRTLIDTVISEFRKGKLSHEVRDILRVGICQLLILKLPDHAAVYETVACARSPVRGLVNAVLRKVAHARARLSQEILKLEPEVRYSHPAWLFKKWKKEFGLPATLKLMEWNNKPAESHYRVNLLKPPVQDLGKESIDLSEVEEGYYYITDPSTQHAIDLLQPMPGEKILDACSAPGGKAIQIAGLMGNEGWLLCTDSNENRLPRLRENLERCGVCMAELVCHDWIKPAQKKWIGAFDAILLDVPCSNTGVMRRRVDVRWRLQERDFASILVLQRKIVEQVLPCLKEGGRLVYSTCSIEDYENKQQRIAIAERHEGLRFLKEIEVYPFQHATDGSYAALFFKKKQRKQEPKAKYFIFLKYLLTLNYFRNSMLVL